MLCKSGSGLLLALGRAAERTCPAHWALPRLVSVSRTSAAAAASTPASETAAPLNPEQAQLFAALGQSIKDDPHGTITNVLKLLTPEMKQQLLCNACKPNVPQGALDSAKMLSTVDQKYVDELFEAADRECPKGFLSKSEFQKALFQHRVTQVNSVEQPSFRALLGLAVASGIPFVGFGFLDNVIMITAGEEIDIHFGAKLGLSTMAAAGLGNLFADVAGIGFANTIEQYVRKMRVGRGPQLSKAQANMRVTTVAKGAGATFGVMVGCLLGLTPLLFMDKARSPHHAEAEAAAAGAAAH